MFRLKKLFCYFRRACYKYSTGGGFKLSLTIWKKVFPGRRTRRPRVFGDNYLNYFSGMKHLFKDFLEDKRVYNLNEAFYKRLIESITGSPATHFFQPTFANGRKIYDDHIFSTKYKGRILQVIQRKPGSGRPVLRARCQKWDGEFDMLVLTLELSDAVKPVLEKIIKAWLVEGEPFESIQAMAPLPTYKTAGPAPVVNDDGA